MIMPIFFNPEDEISTGLKEPIGPCDEYESMKTALGMVGITKICIFKICSLHNGISKMNIFLNQIKNIYSGPTKMSYPYLWLS